MELSLMKSFNFIYWKCLNYSSSAYQQQDTRYSAGYGQTDYNTTQYGTSTDYNAPSADYSSQTGTYDNRSYSGYGKSFWSFIHFRFIE